MTEFPITTTLISDDLAIGWQTAFDLTVELSPVEESANIVRSWNGRARNLAAEEFQLFSVRVSSSSDDMRPPALSAMWPGKTFTMVPPSELSDVIKTGGQTRTLIRNPHPNSIRCLTRGFEDVPFTVSGRVVTLGAVATEPVRIYYRPVLNLFVTEPWRVSSRENKTETSWELVAEEEGPLT